MPRRTYNPHNSKGHQQGFRVRRATAGGRKVLKARRAKNRAKLA